MSVLAWVGGVTVVVGSALGLLVLGAAVTWVAIELCSRTIRTAEVLDDFMKWRRERRNGGRR